MVIAVTIKVVSTVKKFLDLELILFRVADETIDDTGTPHDDLGIEAAIGYVQLFRVSEHVVDFVYIDAVTRV